MTAVPPRGAHVLTIESRVLREPVALELDPARQRPAGFWRGDAFYHILRILGRRFEKGATYLRVLSDRGCFELVRTVEIDPWTWQGRGRWEIVAELVAIPVMPFES